jgi:hypothetical protein
MYRKPKAILLAFLNSVLDGYLRFTLFREGRGFPVLRNAPSLQIRIKKTFMTTGGQAYCKVMMKFKVMSHLCIVRHRCRGLLIYSD